MKNYALLTIVVFCLTATLSNAATVDVLNATDQLKVSRYLSHKKTAHIEQLWPLKHRVNFTANKGDSIRQSIIEILGAVGYELHPSANKFSFILDKPVPPIHKQFIGQEVQEVVHALMGVAYVVVVDPATRYVSFDTKPVVAEIGGDENDN